MSDTPAPGSDAALDEGCTCPVLDNNHGDPRGEFVYAADCPLHSVDDILSEVGHRD